MANYDEVMKRLGGEVRDDKKLELEEIIAIHDKLVEKWGGSYGIRDVNLLRSVAEKPFSSVFGEDMYPSIFDKAAKFLFDFSNYQVFIDGNKRTGLGTCEELLKRNGYELTMDGVALYRLVIDIANHIYSDSSEISPLIKNNVKFIERGIDNLTI